MKKQNDTLVQTIKFTLLSLSAGLVEAASFTLLDLSTTMPYDWKHVISIVLSVLYNFTLNRRYTFKSANNIPVAMLKVSIFYVFFIPITAWLGQIAANAGLNEYLIKGASMVANFVGEFIWWKFIVFRGTENTNDLARREAEELAED
jgi:putative flippase GtrA